MSLYEGAVKKPIMTSLCFLAVAIFGLFSLSKLPVDLYPDIDTNTIMVMTSYQGASASDIENNVTRPLENTLNSVSNLKHITSKSSENISVITLEFEYGYDIDVLTNDVRDKLDMVSSELPDEVNTPIIFKFSTDMIPILLLSVQAEESQPALYKILDDNVVNPLARVPGVGTVSIAGAPKREVNIYCDPNKLEAYDLTIETISSIVGAENKNTPGGTFDVGSNTYSLRVVGEAAGESGRTVQRYIRLSFLISRLLDYVDNKRLSMKAGEKLSFLTVEEQEWVLEAIDNAVLTVTDKQAELFKNHSREKTLNQGIIYSVLLQKKEAEIKVTLSAKKVRSYFPPAYTKQQVEEVIYTLLEQWRKKKGKEEQEDAGDTV